MDTIVAVISGLVLGTIIRRFVTNPEHSPRARGIVKILALYIGAAALALLIANSKLF